MAIVGSFCLYCIGRTEIKVKWQVATWVQGSRNASGLQPPDIDVMPPASSLKAIQPRVIATLAPSTDREVDNSINTNLRIGLIIGFSILGLVLVVGLLATIFFCRSMMYNSGHRSRTGKNIPTGGIATNGAPAKSSTAVSIAQNAQVFHERSAAYSGSDCSQRSEHSNRSCGGLVPVAEEETPRPPPLQLPLPPPLQPPLMRLTSINGSGGGFRTLGVLQSVGSGCHGSGNVPVSPAAAALPHAPPPLLRPISIDGTTATIRRQSSSGLTQKAAASGGKISTVTLPPTHPLSSPPPALYPDIETPSHPISTALASEAVPAASAPRLKSVWPHEDAGDQLFAQDPSPSEVSTDPAENSTYAVRPYRMPYYSNF
jgi:hypothetical protein